jgi:O-glycosyl hydrolase
METILAPGKFDAFGDFLSEVALHFRGEGIAFDYISPLNEPQYGWAPDAPGGLAKQEGTPWTNQNISDVAHAIDRSFSTNGIEAKLILTEAGSYNALLGGTGTAQNQLYELFNASSSLYLGDL